MIAYLVFLDSITYKLYMLYNNSKNAKKSYESLGRLSIFLKHISIKKSLKKENDGTILYFL
ncbi:hypothetical protein MYP_1125 [Sporocytophaga myxococcoides]|uniref:Uncharacterized protein n=1 Tax=Sporocytophaga myxococcoides TaxID=153721 RepID=A0A098LBU9_9BACT|nr:hypothetical protein MYP_1125 [Sporocytophaga myxococcoides]